MPRKMLVVERSVAMEGPGPCSCNATAVPQCRIFGAACRRRLQAHGHAGCGIRHGSPHFPHNRKEGVMAVVPTVQEFLRRANVPYAVFQHARAYTAQEEAAVTHIPGRDWAKAVVCF